MHFVTYNIYIELNYEMLREDNTMETLDRCNHGVERSWCALCNGTSDRIEQAKKEQKKYRSVDVEYINIRKAYEEKEQNYMNTWQEWTFDELDLLYRELVDTVLGKMKRKKTIYELAITLGRTIKSIVWHYKMMKFTMKDMHRGKNMVDYLTQKGIVTYNGE